MATPGPAPTTDLLRDLQRRRGRWLLALAMALPIAVLGAQIADCWFLCDDAYISFRYARNLLEGNGLCFNAGERVEGYTNFLWTVAVAGLWACGLRPEHGAHVLSLLATVATLGLVAQLARQHAAAPDRRRAVFVAVALVATSPSFAVWSTSGLETRAFTAMVMAACALLTRQTPNRGATWLAGVTFGLLALTRPEGLLLFGCAALWRGIADRQQGLALAPDALRLGAPFAMLAGGHVLWRRWYYGDWLPNTYYAKHVRAWYESGLDYLTAATLELGAWIWVPLALVAAITRATRNDPRLLLPFAIAVPHAAYLLHIGGDHFEWRPLDFHLPLLAPAAAIGLLQLLDAGTQLLRRTSAAARAPALLVVAGTSLLLVYTHGLGLCSRLASRSMTTRAETEGLRQQLDATNTPWLDRLPGGRNLAAMLNHVRARLNGGVAAPAQEHIVFGRSQLADYGRCEELPRGTVPPDAVAAYGCVGIMPFHLPGLTVIDTLGLTDATVSRHPVTASNATRVMAHDRKPPPGYLATRGVNLELLPCTADEATALERAEYALAIAPDAWLPLVSHRRSWLQRAFPRERLRARWWLDRHDAAANDLRIDGCRWRGRSVLASFDDGDPGLGWALSGGARPDADREPWLRVVGDRALTTRGEGHAASSARSEVFRAEAGDHLLLFVGGTPSLGLALELLANGQPICSLLPDVLEPILTPVVWPLPDPGGCEFSIELRDEGAGSLTVDHVLLVRPDGPPPAPKNTDLAGAFAAIVGLEPMASDGGRTTSGQTTLRLHNPFDRRIRVEVELVRGTAGSTLECGPWIVDDSPRAWIDPGKTATCTLHLDLPRSEPVQSAHFVVRLRASGQTNADGVGHFDLPLRLRWR